MPAYSTLGVRAVVQMGGFSSSMAAINREIATTNRNLVGLGARSAAASRGVNALGLSVSIAGRNLRFFGNEIANVGMRIMAGIGLPLVLAGAAVTSVGSTFESEMMKINTLVGVNIDTVRRWGEEIRNIAPELARSPRELAAGLFVVTSAGIRDAATAMDVLVNSSKAASVGLGQTADVARLVTSIMQTYGDDVGTAADVTDMLIVAVREGNFEADKLATTLGRVLAVAEAGGAALPDALGFIATFTRTGVPPDVAVTSLRAVMAALIKPTGTAKDVLDRFKLTVDEVNSSVGRNGLAGTLVMLRERMGTTGFTEWLGQIRGASGALAVTGKMAEDFIDIVENIRNSNGATEDSFRQFATTVEFAWGALKAQAESLGITVYEALRPVIKELIIDVAVFLANVEEWVKRNRHLVIAITKAAAALTAFGASLAFIGRVVGTLGSIIQLGGSVITVLGGIAGALGGLAVPILGVVGALGGFVALILTQVDRVNTQVYATFDNLRTGAEEATGSANNYVSSISGAFKGIVDSTEATVRQFKQVDDQIDETFSGMGRRAEYATSIVKEYETSFGRAWGRVAEKAKSWGVNIINQLAVGMIQGAVFVVNALAQLGNLIAYWLSPGSPPKLLPDLDRWGLGAAEAWIDGWNLADVTRMNEMFSDISSFVRSFGEDFWKEHGVDNIPQMLLDIRDTLAEVNGIFVESGEVTQETLDAFMETLSGTSRHVRDLVDAYFDYALATQAVNEAQEELNELTEHYDDALAPIDDRLKEISDIAKMVSEDQRLEELQDILADPFASDQVKDLARLEIEQIGLQREKRTLEDERDAALDAAQAKLDAAKEEQDLAKERLDREKEILELARSGANLLNEVAQKMKEAADDLANALDGLGDWPPGGGQEADLGLGNLFGGDKREKGTSLFQPILDAVDELNAALDNFGKNWLRVFDGLPNLEPLIENLSSIKSNLQQMATKVINYFLDKLIEFLQWLGVDIELPDIGKWFSQFKIPTLQDLVKLTDRWNKLLEDNKDNILGRVTGLIDTLFKSLEKLVGWVLDVYTSWLIMKALMMDWINRTFGPLYLAFLSLNEAIKTLKQRLWAVKDQLIRILQPWIDLLEKGIIRMWEELKKLVPWWEDLVAYIKLIKDFFVEGLIFLFFEGINVLVGTFAGVVEDAAGFVWSLVGAIDALLERMSQIPAGGRGNSFLSELFGIGGDNQFGTPSFRGGLTLVGEAGPELVTLPRGSSILSNLRTERMLAAGVMAGGQSRQVSAGPVAGPSVNFYGPVHVNDPVDLAMFSSAVERAMVRGVRR